MKAKIDIQRKRKSMPEQKAEKLIKHICLFAKKIKEKERQEIEKASRGSEN